MTEEQIRAIVREELIELLAEKAERDWPQFNGVPLTKEQREAAWSLSDAG